MIRQVTRIRNQVKIIPRIRESYDDIKDKRRYRYGYITFGYIQVNVSLASTHCFYVSIYLFTLTLVVHFACFDTWVLKLLLQIKAGFFPNISYKNFWPRQELLAPITLLSCLGSSIDCVSNKSFFLNKPQKVFANEYLLTLLGTKGDSLSPCDFWIELDWIFFQLNFHQNVKNFLLI